MWTKRTMSGDLQVGSGFASKMKKVLSYGSPLKRRRTLSAPSVNSQGLTFGLKLEDILSHPSSPESDGVPLIVSKIVQHIEQHGLTQEGVYRVNGNAKVIERLKIAFDKLGDADIKDTDTYAVGGLLKLFLRELPVAVVPDPLLPEFVRLQEAYPGALTADSLPLLKTIMTKLPAVHYNLLKYLCRHLMIVSQHSQENKMSPVSLSIVFGPNVFRCGGGLAGLQTQGYTNALFCQMIHSYYQVFEDCSSANSSMRTSMDERDEEKPVTVLTEESPSTATFRRDRPQGRRKKPAKPRPYSDYVAEKHTKLALSADDLLSSTLWETSTVHSQSTEAGNESSSSQQLEPSTAELEPSTAESLSTSAVAGERDTHREEPESRKKRSPSSDQVLLRDPAARRRKVHDHEKRKSRLITAESLEDEESAQTVRSSSPHSWQSTSPGTSPPTSPVLTPRSSQAYSSLIEDTIQQYLFEPSTSTNSHSRPPTITSTSSASSGDDHNQEQRSSTVRRERDQAVMDDQVATMEFTEEGDDRKKANSKRGNFRTKGATTPDEQTTKSLTVGGRNSDVQVMKMDFLSDQRSVVQKGGGEGGRQGRKVSELAGMFERNKMLVGPNQDVQQRPQKEGKNSPSPTRGPAAGRADKASPPPVASKPKRRPSSSQPDNEVTSESGNIAEFDYISRTSGQLFHPTLQRVRGPLNRMKPSRRSMMRMKRSRVEDSTKESVGANRSPKSPKKEHIPDIHPHRHHSSPSRNSNGAVNGTGSTSPQTAKNGHRRVAAKSSVHTESNSTQLPTKPAELSNSHHNRLHAEGESNSTGNRADKRTTEQHISPEEKPRRVVGWRDGEKASQDMVDSGSFHLVQRAKDLKTRISRFELDFKARTGRKPESTEKAPVSHFILELATIEKQLKTMEHIPLDKLAQANSPSLSPKLASETRPMRTSRQTNGHTQQEQPERTAIVRRHKSLPSQAKPSKPRVRLAEAESRLNAAVSRITATLEQRRTKDGRPDDLSFMSTNQLQDEKQAVQKALLSFEHKYGRPQEKAEKEVMRPIYDYYRNVKSKLRSHTSRKNGLHQSTQEGLNTTGDTLPSVTMLSSSLAQSVPSNLQTVSTSTRDTHSHAMGLTTLLKRSLPQPPAASLTTTTTAATSGRNRTRSDNPSSMREDGLSSSAAGEKSRAAQSASKEIDLTTTDQQLLKSSLSELQQHYESVLAKKKQLRRVIRNFEIAFEETHKRHPDKSDKQQVYSQYMDYKTIKKRLQLIEILLQKDQLQKTV